MFVCVVGSTFLIGGVVIADNMRKPRFTPDGVSLRKCGHVLNRNKTAKALYFREGCICSDKLTNTPPCKASAARLYTTLFPSRPAAHQVK